MLSIFTPFIFTRNQQLFKIKQEDHIPSMSTVGLVFFLARVCQHKTIKIRITILALPQLKMCILQDGNKFKSTYLAQFNSHRKISQTVGFIFLSNSTLHDECSKIQITSFKSMKINKENQISPQELQLRAPSLYSHGG